MTMILFYDATAGGTVSPEGCINDGSGTPDARLDLYRLCRAVLGASAALHTGVAVFNASVSIVHT